jgi:Domain of Unknown Function (DUF1080)
MLILTTILAAALSAEAPASRAAGDDFLGRWDVRIIDAPDTFVSGWFEVVKKDGGFAGSLVWKWGSVGPAAKVEVQDGTLRLVRQGEAGKTDTFEARLEGATLKGEARQADGKVLHFEGRKAPELKPAQAPRWGKPVTLFDSKTLAGWKPRDAKKKMGWAVVNGELAVVEPKDNSDLVSEKSFQDMKLHLEFNVETHSNSGVYLRGRYEVQILDDPSKATEEHGCGAVYSRIAPKLDATRPAGEWQAFDITFVGRRLTVVLNGKPIIEDAEVEGITGGALNPFEDESGPLMLQGDHGKVRFRNVVVTPAE